MGSKLILLGAGASKWTPAKLPTLRGWWDASRIVGSDGNQIATIPDSSGNNASATQGTAAKRPTLKTGVNGINGLSVARGDGIDDVMVANGAASPFTGADTPHTIFAVIRKVSNSGADDILCAGRASASTPFHVLRTSAAAFQVSRRDDAVVTVSATGGVANTSPAVLVQVFHGTTVTLYKDGAVSINGAALDNGTLTIDQLALFATRVAASEANFMDGDIGEAGVIAGAITDAPTLNKLIGYLGRKWGISVASV